MEISNVSYFYNLHFLINKTKYRTELKKLMTNECIGNCKAFKMMSYWNPIANKKC